MDLEAEYKEQRMDNGKPRVHGMKYELRQNQYRLRIQFIGVFLKILTRANLPVLISSFMLALSICAKGTNLYKRLIQCNRKLYLEAL